MSRYDYRTRRKLFNRQQANPHKNFGAFEQEFGRRRRAQRTSRFLLILIALIFLIVVAIFTAKAESIPENHTPLKGEVEMSFTKKLL